MYQNKLVMPKINNKDIYNQDDTLSMNDFLIGSNSNTGNKKTQTYSLGSIFSLFYNFLGNNAFLNTTDTTTYPIGTPGCFYVFDENGNFTSDFSEANKITFSQYDTYNFDTVNYFSIIVNSGKFLFKLINLENKNNFVFLKPSNFVLSETGTTFDVNVVLEQGLSNGSFVNYKRYLLVLEFAAGNFDPADYDLSDFLNESENPFITEQDLTNALSLLTTPITDHSGLNLDDGTNPHGTTIDDVAKAGNITEEFIQFGEISTSQIQLRKDSNYVALKAENLTEDRELFAPDENGTIATKEWVSFYFTTALQVAAQISTALIGYATQAWVTSQGYITNVITALGYTPANKAGETFTGNISAPNLSGTNTGDETTTSIQTKRPLKTIEGQSLEGSGNIDLTKSDVGLSNVDNTSDLNKPISTATQTALNGKIDKVTSAGVERVYVINPDGSQTTKSTISIVGDYYNIPFDFTHFYRGGCGFLNNFGVVEATQMYSPTGYGQHGVLLKTAANNTATGLRSAYTGNIVGFTTWGQFYFYDVTFSNFISRIGFLPITNHYAFIEADTNTLKFRARTSLNGVETVSPDSTHTILQNVMYIFIYEYISTSQIRFKVLRESTKEVVFDWTSTTNIPQENSLGFHGFQQQRNPNTTANLVMLVFDSYGMAVKKPNFLNDF